ncbi:hypothetical protein L6164_016037 [Bauhinia variegata]|uniref:Uncharacterized protein n=1 Tax=Bauhinia variegata TaxID=167791 RepID=A0ACB9NRE3_BAUVA|nr:hypothetical protein L6164_016037 [Bauhinia variegata]
MAQSKRLRKLIYVLQDKASLIGATLSIRRHVSSVAVPVLRATTHSLSTPPSEARIAAVLSIGHGSYLLPRACINALMDRLHHTHSATVALKCLFTLHNVIIRGPFALRDQLSCYPSYGGHNFLNLSTFRDDSEMESLELSSWVRWYAGVLEQSLSVSRVLGYYLSSSSIQNFKNYKKGVEETRRTHLGLSNSDLLYKIEGLVGYVEQISRVPDSLYLQKNELVYEVVRLVGEDYRCVQYEIFSRIEELGNRMENFDVAELSELLGYLKRMNESKERLLLLFVNRKKNDEFWDLIDQAKIKAAIAKEEIQGKWLLVTKPRRDESTGSTQYKNPFLEPGQLIPVPHADTSRFLLTVPTVG